MHEQVIHKCSLLKTKLEFAVHTNQKLNLFKIHKHEVIIQKLISFEAASFNVSYWWLLLNHAYEHIIAPQFKIQYYIIAPPTIQMERNSYCVWNSAQKWIYMESLKSSHKSSLYQPDNAVCMLCFCEDKRCPLLEYVIGYLAVKNGLFWPHYLLEPVSPTHFSRQGTLTVFSSKVKVSQFVHY